MIPDRHLYGWPLVKTCGNPRFIAETLHRLPLIDARVASMPNDQFKAQNSWLYRKGRSVETQSPWMPKLYLCVGSRDFWNVAERVLFDEPLLDCVSALKVLFFSASDLEYRKKAVELGAFTRPDKIVLYSGDANSLKRAATRLVALKQGAATHAMGHVRSMESLGFLQGNAARGIYAGADPSFLGTSWRIYNAICKSWLGINRLSVKKEYGSVDAWLALMNLSGEHDGPRNLAPDGDVTEFVKLWWPRLVGEDGLDFMNNAQKQRSKISGP